MSVRLRLGWRLRPRPRLGFRVRVGLRLKRRVRVRLRRTASASSSFLVAPTAGAASAFATRLTRVAVRASVGCGRARPGVKPSAAASERTRRVERNCIFVRGFG